MQINFIMIQTGSDAIVASTGCHTHGSHIHMEVTAALVSLTYYVLVVMSNV